MTLSRRFAYAAALIAAAIYTWAVNACAQEAGDVPRGTSATRTDQGILITSTARDDELSLELRGRDIEPLKPERLELRIEGRDVEIVTAPFAQNLMGKPDVERLGIYQQFIVSRWHDAGWQPVNGSDESFSFPTGEKALLWEMQRRPPEGKNTPAQYRIFAATTNRNNIVALVGSADDVSTVTSLKDYLRAALLTLTRDKPEQAHAPTAEEMLNAGADLAEGLEMNRLLTGREFRALLNQQLMTIPDSELAAATPLEPDTLIKAIRLGLQLDGAVPQFMSDVFDGKSAHSIILEGYDQATDTVSYWDPWGHGSFLAAGSNVAGVKATPDPTQERIWLVKGDQFGRVVYAVIMEMPELRKLAANLPLGAFSALGDSLDDARSTDLFTWFHLEQVDSSKNAQGHPVLTFKPTSPEFRPLVSLAVTTSDTGRLLAVDLMLSRSFVDDPKTSVFARDFAKSFLRSATHDRDRAWIESLVNQIEFDVRGMTVLRLHGPETSLPKTPTADYLVFLGQKERTERALSMTELTLDNIILENKPILRISLETQR